MRRRLFILASAVSLLLCAATIALWISSYYYSIHYAGGVIHEDADGFRPFFKYVATTRGEITIACVWDYQHLHDAAADRKEVERLRRFATINKPAFHRYGAWNYDATSESLLAMAGFELWSRPIVNGAITATSTGCSLPLWFVALMFAVMPAARPTTRMIRAVRQAPPFAVSASRRKRERVLTALVLISLGLFILIQVVLHETRTVGASLQFGVPGSTIVAVTAQQRKLGVTWITDWRRPPRFAFVRTPDEFRPLFPYWEGNTHLESGSVLGIERTHGRLCFHVGQDGSISLLPYGNGSNYPMISPSLPYQRIQVSLFQIGLLVIALSTWIVVNRVRRSVKRYNAAAKCLCLHCGYSLSKNSSGTCPECGTAIAAWHPAAAGV